MTGHHRLDPFDDHGRAGGCHAAAGGGTGDAAGIRGEASRGSGSANAPSRRRSLVTGEVAQQLRRGGGCCYSAHGWPLFPRTVQEYRPAKNERRGRRRDDDDVTTDGQYSYKPEPAGPLISFIYLSAKMKRTEAYSRWEMLSQPLDEIAASQLRHLIWRAQPQSLTTAEPHCM